MMPMTIASILIMLVICLVGETVTDKSTEIAKVVESRAYDAFLGDISSLKSVNFVLLRAQKPLRLMVYSNGSMNLSYFSESMNKVVSFFIFLKAVIE